MNLLELKNVRVKINNLLILDKITFEVQKGEIVALVGPNGAGKTMLARAILGLQKYEGKIFWSGQEVRKNLSRIGYVPQYFNFDRTFPLTVREFLNLPGLIKGKRPDKKTCDELQLQNLWGKKLGELSGGQLQRVLIAQAMLKEPELLILDEPTSGVDAEGAKNFYELAEHLNQEHGATIILISHEINMIYKMATKVICLNRNLSCVGRPAEVLKPENLEKIYQNKLSPRPHHH